MAEFDARLTPARADVAAAHLKGTVQAARFVAGRELVVGVGIAALRSSPSTTARLETQLFFGERFTVYDAAGGWAWGQCAFDGYIGYVHENDLGAVGSAATHRIVSAFSHIYEAPDVKAAATRRLPMNAKVAVIAERGRFVEIATGGFVPKVHVASLGEAVADFVAAAEALVGSPYLWGGRSPDGIDCSGLVQSALERAGIAAPRDSDMQERVLGIEVAEGTAALLKRGDLVFWPDHVGIMASAVTLLHANSFHMKVAREPLSVVLARNAASGNHVTSVRRLAQ